MNRRTLLGAVGSASLVGLAGCQETVEELLEEELQGPSCSDVELGAASAKPANAVAVEGLDGFGDEPEAWFHDADIDDPADEERHLASIRQTDDEAELVVPVHPIDWMGGGAIEIAVESEDGSERCSGLELEVEPLDPAPGAIEGMLDEMEEGFAELAQAGGYDLDDLFTADVVELDRSIRGIAAGLQAVAGPDNPNNLRAMLDEEAPPFADDDSAGSIQLRGPSGSGGLPDRSLTSGGADLPDHSRAAGRSAGSRMNERAAQTIDVDAEDVQQVVNALIFESGLIDRVAGVIAEMADIGNELFVLDFDDNEVTPKALDRIMTVQAGIAELNRGASSDLREFTELTAGALSATTAATGVGAPMAAKLGAAGNAVATLGTLLDFYENALPSQLEDIEIEATPTEYNEDFPDDGVPYPGSWTAELEATNREFTIEWVDTVGMIPIAGPAAKFLGRSSQIGQEMIENVLEGWIGLAESTWGVSSEGGPVTVEETTHRIQDGITPGREDEEEYFNWELVTASSEDEEPPFAFDDDESNYWPQSVGVSELRVETADGRFQGQPRGSLVELEVKPIEVEIFGADGSEPPFYLDPEEETKIDLVAEVENANNDLVGWDSEGGEITRTGQQSATFKAPEE